MLSKIAKNKFLKNSILYTLGSMMTPLIGFIMLPVYTNYLSPTEYGVMTIVLTFVGVLQIFLLLSLEAAITRFYYDYLENTEKQKEYLGSIFLFAFLFSTVIAILLIIFSQEVGPFLFSSIPVAPFYFYMVGLAWINALYALPMSLLRAQERAGFYITVNLLKAVLTMLLTVYFIIVCGLGPESVLLSQLIVTTLIVIFLAIWQKGFVKFSLNFKFIKYSLVFSLPLLPHLASGWIIRSSDRIILEKFVSLEEIGIYALAVQVSMVLSIFYSGINNALVPRYTKLRKEQKNEQAQGILKTFLYIVIIFGVLSVPIAMIGASLLSSDAYNEAVWLIPFLIVSEIIKGLYFIVVANLYYSKRTKSIATSSIIAASLNVSINFVLIPLIGIYGAIISTMVAELIRMLLIYRVSTAIKK